MSSKLNNSKILYNVPMSEIIDELYKEPPAPAPITITENSIQFFKEVEFKASQTLSQDSGVKKKQLEIEINNINGLNMSKSDW